LWFSISGFPKAFGKQQFIPARMALGALGDVFAKLLQHAYCNRDGYLYFYLCQTHCFPQGVQPSMLAPIGQKTVVADSHKAFGKEREGLISIILGLLFTAAVFVPLFMLPEEIIDKIPNQLIPGIYTLIIYGIVEAIQGKDLKIHKEEQRDFESNWKATGIGFLWMLVLGGVLVAYIFTSPDITSELDEEITQKMEQISINEEKALKIYRIDPNTSSREELLNAVKDEGIFY